MGYYFSFADLIQKESEPCDQSVSFSTTQVNGLILMMTLQLMLYVKTVFVVVSNMKPVCKLFDFT